MIATYFQIFISRNFAWYLAILYWGFDIMDHVKNCHDAFVIWLFKMAYGSTFSFKTFTLIYNISP